MKRVLVVSICLVALTVSACTGPQQGITEQEKDELVLIGMCGMWQATLDDGDATDEERQAAEDSWRENACGRLLEGLGIDSPSSTLGNQIGPIEEKTEAGAVAYVSSPTNVIAFSEMFVGLFDEPVLGLEARRVGDCAGVRFDSDLIKEMAEELNDDYEPWTIFIRWTDAGWEPAALTGNADVWSYRDADFESLCADFEP